VLKALVTSEGTNGLIRRGDCLALHTTGFDLPVETLEPDSCVAWCRPAWWAETRGRTRYELTHEFSGAED